jgi:tRNA-specific 2-thiouridylase
MTMEAHPQPAGADGYGDAPVFVALSGGVDSAVAACLLKQRTANLTGLSHRHWPESRCCSTECIDRCAEQCRGMGIPYYSVDCMVEFARQVVDDFVTSYERGVTPNPCVLCNEQIRFGLMVEKHHRLRGLPLPPDYRIATGHYARVERRDDRYYLMRGRDAGKDQSYMLYRLSQEELSRCIFPLGDLFKTEVRRLAAEWGLSSAKQGDSQDVCFVQDRYQEFIRQYSEKVQRPGPFVDRTGRELGRHGGIAYYTRGQRSGLGLNGGPWYVIAIDVDTNAIVVGPREDLAASRFSIAEARWIHRVSAGSFRSTVQTRYRGREIECDVTVADAAHATVELASPSEDVTPGQSAVFYRGDDVVGGGIIVRVSSPSVPAVAAGAPPRVGGSA